MNKPQLIVIDIDGTLIPDRQDISSANIRALHKLEEKGLKVALASGRPFESVMQVVRKIGLKGPYHIVSDGAWCGNMEGSSLFSNPLPNRLVEEIVAFARHIELHLELYTLRHGYAETKNWSDYVHKDCLGVKIIYGSFKKLWEKEPILKIGLLAREQSELNLISRLEAEFGEQANFSMATAPCAADVQFFNLVNFGVDKGSALRSLGALYGIEMSEVIAIGDGANDLPLLSVAGFGVAMANGRDQLKEIADYVTESAEGDGVANFLNRFVLNEG